MDEGAQAAPARILVVDDTAANAQLLFDLLEHAGYAVSVVASGHGALIELERDAFDLVLLDIVMPLMDGYEVCTRIRADPRHAAVPVVMVTALDAKAERIKAIECGADDFLTKPISHPELLARVRSLLRIKRMHEHTQRQAHELAQWAATLEQRVAQGVAEVDRLSRLRRFFSPRLAESILAGGADDPLRSHRREIVVLYLDLRGFTSFAEAFEPEEVMRTLSAYHAAIGKLVMDYDATLERFTGDGMVIILGDPAPVERASQKAVSLALAMRQEARELSRSWSRRGVDLGLAIGIAQGYATVGAIGFEGRIDYGAIGTVTNMACRLCEHARADEILIAQRVFAEVEADVEVESLGEILLRGFARPTRAYRCFDARVSAPRSLADGLP